MKKSILLLLFVAVVVVLFVVVKTNGGRNEVQPATADAAASAGKQTEQKVRGIRRAIEWQNKVRQNIATGTYDFADVYRARKVARENKLAKAGGSQVIEWEFMGPDNVGGRTRTILFDKDDPNKMITGGVAGGIFTSDNGGLEWHDHPDNDHLESLAISCGATSANGDIYLGTGEGFYYYFGTGAGGVPGEGILKSTDGGDTYEYLAATKPTNSVGGPDDNNANNGWAAVNSIATHPTDNNVVYAAIQGGAGVGGIQRSDDGGQTWSVPNGIGTSASPGYDVVIGSNGVVHVIVGSTYFRSEDGENFVSISGTNPGEFPQQTGRKRLAVSPSNPNYVYAVIIKPGTGQSGCLDVVLQSTDGGLTWSEIGVGDPFFEPMGNGAQCQGWYDLAIAVDPANPERVFLAGVTLWVWESGISSGWTQIDNLNEQPDNLNYVHADKHHIAFKPGNPDVMYIACDGGIFRSNNAGDQIPTFQPFNKNLNITQFYSAGATYDGRAIGGTQDNGTQFASYESNSPNTTVEVRGGDGGHVAVSKLRRDPPAVFVANPNGALYRSSNGGTSFGVFLDEWSDCYPRDAGQNCEGDDLLDIDAEFVTPFHLWEDVAGFEATGEVRARFVTGSGGTPNSSGGGTVWMTNNPLDFIGRMDWVSIGQVSSGSVTAVTVSADGQYVYAGSSSGRLLRITGLDNITYNAQGKPIANTTKKETTIASGRYITGIDVNLYDDDNVVVSVGNYGASNYVYRSTNATATSPTYLPIQGVGTDALPPMPVYDIAVSANNPLQILAATEMGVWLGEVNGTQVAWSSQNDGIGNVPVFSLSQEIMKADGCYVTYIGTHGRGIYRTTSLTSPFCNTDLPSYPITGVEPKEDIIAASLKVFPNPMVDNATVEFDLDKVANVSLSVYDMQGRLVLGKEMGRLAAGKHNEAVAMGNAASGNYMLVLKAGDVQATQKITVQ